MNMRMDEIREVAPACPVAGDVFFVTFINTARNASIIIPEKRDR